MRSFDSAKWLGQGVDGTLEAHDLLKIGLPVQALDTFVTQFAGLRHPDNFHIAFGASRRDLLRRKGGAPGRLNSSDSGRLWTLATAFSHAVHVFGTAERASKWFTAPVMALNQRRPLDLSQTDPGRKAVSDLLIRLEYGVYT
jgi:putative toxin-antitoxin system antitoxin component (TIGR02293 family)